MGRYQRDHNPAGWGFGVTIGVVLAVLLVVGLFVLICGGGCVMLMGGMGVAINNAAQESRSRIESEAQPAVESDTPATPKPPKMELLSSDATATPPTFKVRIWEGIPTEANMAIAIDRMRVEESRRVLIYSLDQSEDDAAYAEFVIDAATTERVR